MRNESFIPYGRQWIDEDDIAAVVETLRSDWLTTGPKVEEFEKAVARFVGASQAIAVSSGTAGLHCAMHAAGIGPGDEVILPPMTFVATANSVLFQGGTPVFADIEPDTLLLDPAAVEKKITPRTKAIVAVDYAGQACDYDALRSIAKAHGLLLIADACHSLGAEYKGQRVGTLADFTIFSFHPVKHITTGEGGMVVTGDPELAAAMRRFRNHGINTDHRQREAKGTWHYEMVNLGYNYRITDIQCALGISQLKKLTGWLERRREIAREYDIRLADRAIGSPLRTYGWNSHAYHLYVLRFPIPSQRQPIFEQLRGKGVGANVHYIPVHLHPFYRQRFGTGTGSCPVAEAAYQSILSLPMHPGLTTADIDKIFEILDGDYGR